MMTLKEAIEHCLEKSLSCNNQECALEHFQLFKWLQEYKSMLEKQGEKDVRQKFLEDLLVADDIYQMSMNEAMVEEARTKAINALSELEISKLLGIEKQGEQKQDVNVQINPSEYVNDMGGNGCYLKNTTQTSTWSKKEEKVDNQNCVKSVDDVKPKFKVGDWISNDMCDAHIASIEDGMYYFDEGDGLSIVFVDEHYHLWTIEDAMDGDVLFHSDSASNGIFIFKEIIDKGFAKEVICYCDYDSEDHFCLGEDHTCCWSDAKILYPATKEQCDLLFSKIKEAGYEWDSKKKELKIIDWSKHIKYEKNSPSIIEENTMWGEEDEDHLNSLIDLLPGLTIRHNWLKSLKDRIQHQPKQEWSDEDEYMLDETIQHLKQLIEIDKAKHCGCDVQYYQRDIDWLKSLRPHKQWKPSEEQMDALETAVSSIQSNTLETLYQDLKREKNYE